MPRTKETIKPLATIHRVLTWICVCQADKNTSKWKKFCFIIITCILFVTIFFSFATSYVFFTNTVSTDLEEALYALLQVFAFAGLAYVVTSAVILRQKFEVFLKSLSEIYQSSKNSFKHTFHQVKNIMYLI